MIDRQNKKVILILISLFIALHIPLLLHSVSHTHRWRQADTAAVAKNFYEESFNIMYPRVDIRGEKSGITGMEFPLYQYLSGILYFVFDTSTDMPGKLISLACSVAALLLLISLGGSMRETISATPIAIVYLTFPFIFFYSTAFMPELFALSLALAGTYYFIRYEESGRTSDLAPSIMFFCLSALSRPFLIFLCYPLVDRFFVDAAHRKFNRGVFLGGSAILAVFSFWYFYWDPYLVKEFGLDVFFFGSDIHQNIKTMLSFPFWALLLNEIVQSYLGWIWLPFTVHGAYVLLRRGDRLIRYFSLSGVIGIVVLGILTGRHFAPHNYYLIFILPFLVYSSACSLGKLLSNSRVNIATVGVLLLLFITATKLRIYREDRVLMNNMGAIQSATAGKDLVAVEDVGGYSYSLHFLRRKGWVLSEEQMRDPSLMRSLHDKGAVWAIPREKGKSVLYPIEEWEKRIAR